jgi:hypothetical protein
LFASEWIPSDGTWTKSPGRATWEVPSPPTGCEVQDRCDAHIYRYAIRNQLDEQTRRLSRSQHIAVAKAVLDDDGAKAEKLMRQHVRTSGTEVLRIVDAMN